MTRPTYGIAQTSVALLCLLASLSGAQMAAGANKFVGNITTNGNVHSSFLKYWNQISPENEGKWGSVEGSRGNYNWTGMDRIAKLARDNKFPYKFHVLVWGQQQPSWMGGLSQAEQLKAITAWYDAAKAKYPDVQMIDVVNEAEPGHAPAGYKNALGGDGSTGYDWIIKAFKMARERWPNAILIYNDYNNIEYDASNTWTYNLVKKMIEQKAPIDAIGLQAHDAWKLSTAAVKTKIDKLASLGLPLYITEYDIGESDDTKQKNIMESQFTMFWNHPKIAGITYWGIVVGTTWRTGTGLMTASGAERPALTWLKNYLATPANKNPPCTVAGCTTVGIEPRMAKEGTMPEGRKLRVDMARMELQILKGDRVFDVAGRD